MDEVMHRRTKRKSVIPSIQHSRRISRRRCPRHMLQKRQQTATIAHAQQGRGRAEGQTRFFERPGVEDRAACQQGGARGEAVNRGMSVLDQRDKSASSGGTARWSTTRSVERCIRAISQSSPALVDVSGRSIQAKPALIHRTSCRLPRFFSCEPASRRCVRLRSAVSTDEDENNGGASKMASGPGQAPSLSTSARRRKRPFEVEERPGKLMDEVDDAIEQVRSHLPEADKTANCSRAGDLSEAKGGSCVPAWFMSLRVGSALLLAMRDSREASSPPPGV